VLGGKYLDVANNPYVQGYANAVSRDFQENLRQGLSEVSSPFSSGSTLGQSGIHADTRGRYFSEGQEDLGDTLAKTYFGVHEAERGRQQQTSGDISGRTNQLVGSAASAYGADQQVKQARIAADAQLKQAKMAQALGYDELAQRSFFEYERLTQEAYQFEQDMNLRYLGAVGGIGRDFSDTESTQTGPRPSTAQSVIQGVIGGATAGAGAYYGTRQT
jgi:hypothetical protein